MNKFLVTVLTGLAWSGAHAAHWEVASYALDGGFFSEATVDGDTQSLTGQVADVSDSFQLFGQGYENPVVALGAGELDYLWSRSALLDVQTEPGVASFALGGLSNLVLTQVGRLEAFSENASISLTASLRIVGDGEVAGSPVRVTLNGSALSGFESDIPGVEDLPAFDLYLAYGPGEGIGYAGLPSNSEEGFSGAFDARIGDQVEFRLVLDTFPAFLGQVAIGPNEVRTVNSQAWLSGALAISPVPEPETWGLLLAGLALTGLRLRRQPRP